jgi:hypothetical protein
MRKTLPLAAFVLALFLGMPAGMPAAWAAISSTPVLETWGTNGRVRALVELNGILYVGGSFTEAASSDGSQTRPRSNLMAIDMSTGQPTNWAPVANNLVLSIATDGVNLFVGGKFTDLGPHIAEVSTSGAVVAGFGAKTNGLVRSIDVVGSTLYVGGDFTTVNHASQPYLAAMNTNGNLQTAFDPSVNGAVFGVASFASGNLLIVGLFSYVDGQLTGTAAEVAPTGDVAAILFNSPSQKTMSVYAEGTTGYIGVAGSGNEAIAYDESGSKLWRVGCNGDIQAITKVDNEVIIAGHYGKCATLSVGKLTAVSLDGTIDTSWKPHVKDVSSRKGVYAVLGSPSTSTFWAGGDFTTAAGFSTPHLAGWTTSP